MPEKPVFSSSFHCRFVGFRKTGLWVFASDLCPRVLPRARTERIPPIASFSKGRRQVSPTGSNKLVLASTEVTTSVWGDKKIAGLFLAVKSPAGRTVGRTS